MMDNRVLELLFQPHLMQKKDLPLIENEITKFPFVQSIRALYLLGVSNFQQEQYAETLAKTAAFTTDKKILYVLVNGKKTISKIEEVKEIKTENIESLVTEEEIITQNDTIDNEVSRIEKSEQENVQKNAIDKEEKREALDITEKDHQSVEVDIAYPVENETQETILTEDASILSLEEEEKEMSRDVVTEINFYENTESSFTHASVEQKEKFTPNFQSVDKYEEERRKLIEEVEKKLKEKRQNQPRENVEEEVFSNDEINFSESEMALEREEKNEPQQEATHWQPMNLETLPNAFRNRTTESSNSIYYQTEKKESIDYLIENQKGKEISEVEIPTSNSSIATEEAIVEQNEGQPNKDSNVPSFLSTWQSWLKIDRATSVKTFTSSKKIKIEEIKAQAIDKFIATEPKISPVKKDDPQPVPAKERKDDDISHLMTETLANIYVEQRLYNRAIDAYEVLCEKNPSKKEEFLLKIEEIKQLKNANSGQWS